MAHAAGGVQTGVGPTSHSVVAPPAPATNGPGSSKMWQPGSQGFDAPHSTGILSDCSRNHLLNCGSKGSRRSTTSPSEHSPQLSSSRQCWTPSQQLSRPSCRLSVTAQRRSAPTWHGSESPEKGFPAPSSTGGNSPSPEQAVLETTNKRLIAQKSRDLTDSTAERARDFRD